MKALVIGGDGMVGSALVGLLRERNCAVVATTRRRDIPEDRVFMDLAQPVHDLLPCEVVYIVAAVNGFEPCQGNSEAYRVNVDAPTEIARLAALRAVFPVFISSDCVEWCGATDYARHKAMAEIAVRLVGGAVVRPCRIEPTRVRNLCEMLFDIGMRRAGGVYHWKKGRVAC